MTFATFFYTEGGKESSPEQLTLPNDAFRKAVSHAKEFIYCMKP